MQSLRASKIERETDILREFIEGGFHNIHLFKSFLSTPSFPYGTSSSDGFASLSDLVATMKGNKHAAIRSWFNVDEGKSDDNTSKLFFEDTKYTTTCEEIEKLIRENTARDILHGSDALENVRVSVENMCKLVSMRLDLFKLLKPRIEKEKARNKKNPYKKWKLDHVYDVACKIEVGVNRTKVLLELYHLYLNDVVRNENYDQLTQERIRRHIISDSGLGLAMFVNAASPGDKIQDEIELDVRGECFQTSSTWEMRIYEVKQELRLKSRADARKQLNLRGRVLSLAHVLIYGEPVSIVAMISYGNVTQSLPLQSDNQQENNKEELFDEGIFEKLTGGKPPPFYDLNECSPTTCY